MMTLGLLVFGRKITEVKASLVTFISRILKEKLISPTYNTSATKCVGFPHQTIIQSTNWVSHNLILSNTDYPELAQPPQVKAQSHKTFSPSLILIMSVGLPHF